MGNIDKSGPMTSELEKRYDLIERHLRKEKGGNSCFIIIVTTLQAHKLSMITFNLQTKTSKVA